MIDWNNPPKKTISDGKHNSAYSPVDFPPYLDNPNFPFTYSGDIKNKYWSATDSETEFLKNLKRMPEDWRYRTKKIEYHVNSNGYRAPEWDQIDWKESIVLFGCSCTFGIGLGEDETISYNLQKLIGRPVINLGFPGGSNDLILQNSTTLLEKFGVPYAVVMNWTCTDRFRYFFKNGYHDVGSWISTTGTPIIENVDLLKFWELKFLDRTNELVLAYNIGKFSKLLWQDKTKYITLSFFDLSAHFMRADKFFFIDNQARDRLHPGYNNAKQVADYIAYRL